MTSIIFCKAKESDLKFIIELLLEDDLGKTRESLQDNDFAKYKLAFNAIENDKNQYLMIGKIANEIVATCHLTIMPSLTFQASTRLQIEAVRVKQKYRGQKIGEQVFDEALIYAKQNNCKIIQLTTNKQRNRAKKFYEKLGFEASHEGMKMMIQ